MEQSEFKKKTFIPQPKLTFRKILLFKGKRHRIKNPMIKHPIKHYRTIRWGTCEYLLDNACV